MSRPMPDRKPLIALVHDLDRVFQAHMVREAHSRGRTDVKPAHNALLSLIHISSPRDS